jgi:hypothetical protein
MIKQVPCLVMIGGAPEIFLQESLIDKLLGVEV